MSKVVIATEFKCTKYGGELFLAPKAYLIFKRYADAFGKITLISRVNTVEQLPRGYKKASFIKDYYFINGLAAVLLGKYNVEIERALNGADLLIARVPSAIAYVAAEIASKNKISYISEVMGEAWDSYWNHGDILGKVVAPYMEYRMRHVVYNASYSIYVTKDFLQKRYRSKCPSINASNVYIEKDDSNILERRILHNNECDRKHISMMTSASVEAVAKGHEYVIKAIPILKKRGISVSYYLAGGGNPERLKKIAKNMNVENNVVFLGELPMDKLYEQLDKTDIYVQPSLQEGLPRSVIEAMSRGCQCIGTNTAGTPELIEQKYIFNKKSPKSIADAVCRILESDFDRNSINNINKSAEYYSDVLDNRRNIFFARIRKDLNISLNTIEKK